MTIQDNREILRYRGISTPSDTIFSSQQAALKSAVLNIEKLSTNVNAEYFDAEKKLTKQVDTNPFMRLLPPNGSTTDTVYDFYFPFTPQNISYSDMADEIAEIPRAGTTPLVTFKSHKLLKISFEFLIAIPYDGMTLDVESSIDLIRTFSTYSNRSIIFFNMDNMLTSAWQYRRGPASRPLQFNITDMSITARQRNSFGKITQAVVNISFIENQNPEMVITRVPPFIKKPPKKPPTLGPPPTKTERIPAYSSDANATAGQREFYYLTAGIPVAQ